MKQIKEIKEERLAEIREMDLETLYEEVDYLSELIAELKGEKGHQNIPYLKKERNFILQRIEAKEI